MDDQLLIKLVEVLPSLLWIVFAFIVFLALRRPLERQLLPRLQHAKGFGLELSFARASLEAAIESKGVDVNTSEKRGVIFRARRI